MQAHGRDEDDGKFLEGARQFLQLQRSGTSPVREPQRVLQQRQGLSTGLASSVSSSRTATLTRSWEATQTRTVREAKHTWLDNQRRNAARRHRTAKSRALIKSGGPGGQRGGARVLSARGEARGAFRPRRGNGAIRPRSATCYNSPQAR